LFFHNNRDDDADLYKNPCETTFAELKAEMTEVSDDVFKKVLKKPADDAKEIDLMRTRVTYHRNMSSTMMKEGEHSWFVIGYKKMLKELGCGLRVSFKINSHVQ
jgi:hypothetical protein